MRFALLDDMTVDAANRKLINMTIMKLSNRNGVDTRIGTMYRITRYPWPCCFFLFFFGEACLFSLCPYVCVCTYMYVQVSTCFPSALPC